MKTFQEFLSEDAASDTSSTISRGVVGGGSVTLENQLIDHSKKRPKTGLGTYLKDKFKNRDKDKPEKEKPGRDTSYRGQGTEEKTLYQDQNQVRDHHQKVDHYRR